MSSAKDKIRYIIDVIDEQLGLLPEGDRGFQVSRYTLMGGMFLDFDEIDSIIRKLNTDDWGLSINLMSKSSDSRSLDIYRVSLVDESSFSIKKQSFFENNKHQSTKGNELVIYEDNNIIRIVFRDKKFFVNGEKVHGFYKEKTPLKLWNYGLENQVLSFPFEELGLTHDTVQDSLSGNHRNILFGKIESYCSDHKLILPQDFFDKLLQFDTYKVHLFKIQK
ncbi:hypothetical protein HOE49_01250 [Candidatus Peregrinibacteria bacterium]|nr:hypothetical protein [Candidatus Peregrinibacteria bacterium]